MNIPGISRMIFLNKRLVAVLVLTTLTARGQVHQNTSGMKLFNQANKKVKVTTSPPRRVGGAIIFRDDFNTLDVTRWQHEVSMYGSFSNHFQVFTNDPQNSFTKDGHLYIKPTLTVSDPRFDENFLHHGTMDMKSLFGLCTNNYLNGCHRTADKDGINPPVMSARLNSVPTLRYGVIEVRARISKGDWLHPSIWLRSKNHQYGPWPRSGEIDIMESRGNSGYFGVDTISSALHWGPDASHDLDEKTTKRKKKHTWADDFHTWRMEWTPDHIIITVDNKEILNVDPGKGFWDMGGFAGDNIWASGGKMAPFDKDFYMILTVSVGGTGGMFRNKKIKKPWHSNTQREAMEEFWKARKSWEKTWVGNDAAMVVDYVEMRHL